MNVITMASRSVGCGKTTLTAHLTSAAHAHGCRFLAIDADPLGALATYNSRRSEGALPLSRAERGIARQIAMAELVGYDWVFIDTPATDDSTTNAAISVATLVVIPMRPTLTEVTAVRETVNAARAHNKPYIAVFNAVPVGCEKKESLTLAEPRAFLQRYAIPLWSGRISQCSGHGHTAGADALSRPALSIEVLQLWSTIVRSVGAIHQTQSGRAA